MIPERSLVARSPVLESLLRWTTMAVIGLGLATVVAWAAQLGPLPVFAAVGGLITVVATIADPRIGLGALAFAMVLSPEVGDVVYVRADDVIVGAVVIGWLARQAVYREPLLQNPLLVPMTLLAVAGLASMCLAIAGANVDPFTGQGVPLAISVLHWVKRLEYFAILFLVAQTLRTRGEVGWFAGLLLAAGVLVSLRGMAEIAMRAGDQGFRLDAPFDTGEANTLGEYLMLILALNVGLLLTLRSARIRLVLGGVLVLGGYTFLYTFSRGAYVALVAVVLVVALLKEARLLVLAAALVYVLPPYLPAEVNARVQTIPREVATLDTADVGSNALLARVDSYRQAARQVASRPFLGHGPGVVALERIESQYAREAIDGGLVGLALFLWFLGRTARLGRQVFVRARDRLEGGMGLGYVAGVAGMAVAALGAIPFTTIRTMEAFAFLTGLAVVLWRLQGEEAGVET